MIEYLIVCPLVFLGGFVDAIAGGGGLITLPAYMIAGLPVHNAIGTNKFSSCMGTAVTTFRYARKGMIDLRRSWPAIVVALGAAFLGARLALMVPNHVFTKVMMVIVPVTALLVLRVKHFESDKPALSAGKTMLVSSALSFVIGVYDGFYGPGTGTFLILLLVYVARMSLQQSAGLTKAINLSTNVAALFVFLVNGVVLFPLAVVASAFGIMGNYLGASLFISRGKNIAKPIILIVLVIFMVRLFFLGENII